MNRAREVWTSQCDATSAIRGRFGVQAALEYLVSEKLLRFADAAASHPDFAHELPLFVAQVRRMFAPEDVKLHVAALLSKQEAVGHVEAEEDDRGEGSSEVVAARLQRLRLIGQLLDAAHLGTS